MKFRSGSFMKILLALLLVICSLSNLYAKTLVVTDIDDTIKYTNVLDKSDAVYNALFSKRAFSGMSELFQEFNKTGAIIYYVSGSPKILSNKISDFMSYNKFPQSTNVILKGIEHTYDFKLKTISTLIDEIMPDKIILIGDDTEFDPEIYAELSKHYKVDQIFIHSIQNRAIPSNDHVRSYFSAVEIAGYEMLEGNLKAGSLEKVARSFIHQLNDSSLVIPGRYCPRQGSLFIEELKQKLPTQTSIEALELSQQKIIKTCTK